MAIRHSKESQLKTFSLNDDIFVLPRRCREVCQGPTFVPPRESKNAHLCGQRARPLDARLRCGCAQQQRCGRPDQDDA